MFENILNKIKEYNNIVIARHVGPDPDALGSQFALREAVKKSFPEKTVLAVGLSSPNYNYFPKADKFKELDNMLVIVLDVPNLERVDIKTLDYAKEIIKIDHHPVVDIMGKFDYVDVNASSTCEIILKFIRETNLFINKEIAKYLFMGIVSDTNRFLYSLSKDVLNLSSWLIDNFNLDTEKLYYNVYSRTLAEVKLNGYICQNMNVSDNGFAYIYISDDIQKSFGVDSSSAGNLVNNFNNIKEVIVWAIISDDIKNERYKVNIRSRGPIINDIAENFGGGGHKFASGAKPKTLDDAMNLMKALDERCLRYKEEENEDK